MGQAFRLPVRRGSLTAGALAALLSVSAVAGGTAAPAAAAREPRQAAGGPGDNTLTSAEAAAGWVLLFDGRTLNGWREDGKAKWRAEDGAITVDPLPVASGNLMTTANYADFELTLEFWDESNKSNSGVYFRCGKAATGGAQSCYEMNISDESDSFPTGSVTNVQSTLPERADSARKWNSLVINASGDHLVVTLNGKKTTDAHDAKLASGAIGLQGVRFATIRFRNIKIRPLGATGRHD